MVIYRWTWCCWMDFVLSLKVGEEICSLRFRNRYGLLYMNDEVDLDENTHNATYLGWRKFSRSRLSTAFDVPRLAPTNNGGLFTATLLFLARSLPASRAPTAMKISSTNNNQTNRHVYCSIYVDRVVTRSWCTVSASDRFFRWISTADVFLFHARLTAVRVFDNQQREKM